MPARNYFVCKRRKPPERGETFTIVDKAVHGSKPFQVYLTDIKTHTGGGDIYFVELL